MLKSSVKLAYLVMCFTNDTDPCLDDSKDEFPAGDLDNGGIPNGTDVCGTDSHDNCSENCAGDSFLNCDDDPCPIDASNLCPAYDKDRDTIPNPVDNCPSTPNRNQRDIDNEFIEFACDFSLDCKNPYLQYSY